MKIINVNNKPQGVIVRISGPVVDVKFEGYTPKIYEALEVEASENSLKLILETEQLLAAGLVRTVAMGATEGLKRNLIVTATGNPITVPVGPETLGRIFDVLGRPIDDLGPVKAKFSNAIHQLPPLLTDQETSPQMLETGIKVIDLIAPFPRGGKVAALAEPESVRRSSFRN